MYKLFKLPVPLKASNQVIVTLMALLMLSACTADKSPQSGHTGTAEQQSAQHEEIDALTFTEAELKQFGISIIAVTSRPLQDQLTLTANIVANQNKLAHVTPRIEGKLSKVIANLGDQVTAGQRLAEIDSIQMGEARAQYRSSQSELALALANFERISRLHEDKVVPQKQLLESQSVLERAKSAAYADSERLRMYGGLSKENGSTYVLTAPFAGIVLEKNAVIGELAKTTDSIFTIADMSTVWIEADVPERDLKDIAIGKTAAVTVSAYPEEVFSGKVSYLASVVDKTTRTVKARIELRNPEHKLRIDMFATAVLSHAASQPVLVVPAEAIVMIQGIPHVYIALPQTVQQHATQQNPVQQATFEARPVALGQRVNAEVEIKSGLREGEHIVQSGVYALKARQLKSQISDEH
ncbi:MAG: efflux RND transporter periplasmic adaptor subunit [Methylophilus sp.]|uniref:efflux RND transporter periplasmic adaptor subunit n=1 Tax=Methylophilus sp. TaxID=29541 RepID=UPI003FA1266F